MNCGSGFFLFTTDIKKLYKKKTWLTKKFFKTVTILSYYLVKKGNFPGILKNYQEPGPEKEPIFTIGSTTLVANPYLEEP
jgi:hypothetical protein